jgi:hypothetical protein
MTLKQQAYLQLIHIKSIFNFGLLNKVIPKLWFMNFLLGSLKKEFKLQTEINIITKRVGIKFVA